MFESHLLAGCVSQSCGSGSLQTKLLDRLPDYIMGFCVILSTVLDFESLFWYIFGYRGPVDGRPNSSALRRIRWVRKVQTAESRVPRANGGSRNLRDTVRATETIPREVFTPSLGSETGNPPCCNLRLSRPFSFGSPDVRDNALSRYSDVTSEGGARHEGMR